MSTILYATMLYHKPIYRYIGWNRSLRIIGQYHRNFIISVEKQSKIAIVNLKF